MTGTQQMIVNIGVALLGIFLPLMWRSLSIKFSTFDKKFETLTTHFNNQALQINSILQGDVRQLQASVNRLESGQDEWTKTLRERTHDLANEMNTMRLEIELLKVGRPHKGPS